MALDGRVFRCVRCDCEVRICSRCDRGNRYCGRQCSGVARRQSQQAAGQLYQRSWRGLHCHAARQRSYRERCRVGSAQIVTHRGSARHAVRGGISGHEPSEPPAHAHALLACLGAHPLSTRELHAWYQHNQQANRPTRERLVENPALFVHTLRARDEAASLQRLREGPEGQCLADLGCVEVILKRLRKRLASVCAHAALPDDLHQAFSRIKSALARLDDDVQRYRVDDPAPDP